MGWFSWSFALSVLALACSVLSLRLVYLKAPTVRAKSLHDDARALAARWETEVNLFEATRERWSAEFSGIAERCDEMLDRTESKRRRVAATESRQNASLQPAAEMTRDDIINAARRRTLGQVGAA